MKYDIYGDLSLERSIRLELICLRQKMSMNPSSRSGLKQFESSVVMPGASISQVKYGNTEGGNCNDCLLLYVREGKTPATINVLLLLYDVQ